MLYEQNYIEQYTQGENSFDYIPLFTENNQHISCLQSQKNHIQINFDIISSQLLSQNSHIESKMIQEQNQITEVAYQDESNSSSCLFEELINQRQNLHKEANLNYDYSQENINMFQNGWKINKQCAIKGLTLCYQDKENNIVEAVKSPLQDLNTQTQDEKIKMVKISVPKKRNYQKNICSYMTKKAIQCFLSKNQSKFVHKLCKKIGCDYEQSILYYSKMNKIVSGIGHLSQLITPQNQSQKPMKQMFCSFFNWFLRQRYILYLLRQGKMTQKQKYIDFKNKYLLNIAQISSTYSYMF